VEPFATQAAEASRMERGVSLAAHHLTQLDPGGDRGCCPMSPPTFCMAKILLPVDFSEACTRSAHHAAALAQRFDSD
jgi:hypothetical protein